MNTGQIMNRGENMYNKIKVLIFTVLVVVLSAAAVYADRVDTGWKGYGLYNLNKSEVIISNESDIVTINGGNAAAVYEYTIKNNSGKNITVNFGYPDNGIKKFNVHDGSKYLSYKTRDTAYLKTNYGVQNLQTPEVRWYLFNMVFTPDQTRTIKVNIEVEMKKEENDTYGLSFFKDRSYSYAINSEKTDFTLKLEDFKPYNIYELDGIKPEEISSEGVIALSYGGSYGSGVSLRYQPIDKMAVERVNASTYKKPKAIVKAFDAKNYDEALKLSDEYIAEPADSRLSLEQVKYIRAESIKLLNNSDEYLSAVEQLDISKLYPGRIRYKVLVDRLEAYNAVNNDEGIDKILEELIPEIQQSYPYLLYWLDQKGYRLSESEQEDPGIATHTENAANASSRKSFDILGAVIVLLTTLRESRWTYTVLGLLVGFILGRFSKRSKRKKSVYLFRD
ncbi:MAG: hypothetical protein APF77_18705 [Clostridia bacterium BRH_c25]|nr:MAG: hypothetical protein APF77_18705 [Clostridia bacterium BRH_c25]